MSNERNLSNPQGNLELVIKVGLQARDNKALKFDSRQTII